MCEIIRVLAGKPWPAGCGARAQCAVAPYTRCNGGHLGIRSGVLRGRRGLCVTDACRTHERRHRDRAQAVAQQDGRTRANHEPVPDIVLKGVMPQKGPAHPLNDKCCPASPALWDALLTIHDVDRPAAADQNELSERFCLVAHGAYLCVSWTPHLFQSARAAQSHCPSTIAIAWATPAPYAGSAWAQCSICNCWTD